MDLQDKINLGAAMFATPAIDRGATTMLVEVASDADGGEVSVELPDEEGTVQLVTVPCNGDLREGDTATCIVEDGRITAISAGGEGERTKAETEAAQAAADAAKSAADAASSAASAAQAAADEAKATATATGQHFFADDNGAHVTTDAGNVDGTSNLLMNSEGVAVRSGANPLTMQSKSGFSIFDGKGSAAENINASFTKSGVTMCGGDCYINANEWSDSAGQNHKYLHIGLKQADYVYGGIGIGMDSNGGGESAVFTATRSYAAGNQVDVTIGDFQECGDMKLYGQQIEIVADPTNEADDGEGDLILYGQSVLYGSDKRPMTFAVEDGAEVGLHYKTPEGVTKNAALAAYPVGSIYMSVNSTSPATLFGGTWEEIAGGRVLLGQNSTYKAGTTGGAATHTHTGPAHTHAYGAKFSSYYGILGMTNANGSTFNLWNGSSWVAGSGSESTISVKVNTGLNAASATKSVASPYCKTVTGSSGTGNTGSASSLPPYLAVYMWKRTA